MLTVNITKEMISEEICGHLCMMAEMMQTQSHELTDTFVFVKNWNDKGALSITWQLILQGYHCYGTDRIPKFISKDWNLSFKIYKKLKGL